MRGFRILELAFGVAAGTLGLATLGWAFFSPAYAGESTVCDSSGLCQTHALPPMSIVQEEGRGTALPTMLFFGAIITGVLIGAIWDGRWTEGQRAARNLLWICTAVLFGCIVLSLLSIGLFFVPCFGCGVIASVVAAMRARRATAA